MADPLGLVNALGPARAIAPLSPQAREGGRGGGSDGPDFKQLLREQLDEVNQLQRDASQAMEDLAIGRRDDLEGVIIATQKADIAFRMLLQVRNKVMDAYEEIKQIRV